MGRGAHPRLVVGKEAFAACRSLEKVIFDAGSVVEEIATRAFYGSGLQSFVAPPSLREIGAFAFRECRELKDFRLNEDIQKVRRFCFWQTGITHLALPSHIPATLEQLGIGDGDPKVLRIPDGFEVIGDIWFAGSDIEKVIVPSSVKSLRDCAFAECAKLCEVVFEPGSQLTSIGTLCFNGCGFREITIPRNVHSIGDRAFCNCRDLSSIVFEKGSAIKHVAKNAFFNT